jgi:hypothetical protein
LQCESIFRYKRMEVTIEKDVRGIFVGENSSRQSDFYILRSHLILAVCSTRRHDFVSDRLDENEHATKIRVLWRFDS